MFAKLLKYEWKATAPLLSILSLVCLVTGLLCGVSMQLTKIDWDNSTVDILIGVAVALTFLAFFVVLIGYGLGTTLLVLHRFYKNKFTDEGYLTFTLPVSAHQIFLSSLLNLLIWQVISMCVIMASFVLLFGVGGYLSQFRTAFAEFPAVFQEVFSYQDGTVSLLSLLTGLFTWLFGCILAMTCIVLGAAWAKKHKLLLAFALYYGIYGVLQFVLTIISFAGMLTGLENADPVAFLQVFTICTGILYLLLAVGGYFLSTRMMSKRLNLS